MHPAVYYALKSGAKISKPNIYQKYQPIPYNKFILINLKNKKYKYWQEALDLIYNELEKNGINLIQIIENREQALKKANYFIDQKDFNTNAYLCNQSLMYIGELSIEMHMASIFNKKMLLIYDHASVNLDNIKPYWSKDEDICAFEIKEDLWPEAIAKSILKLLKIKTDLTFETHFIGPSFLNKKLEVIPNQPFDISKINQIENHIIRMDVNFKEDFLNEFLFYKKALIFTNKPINLKIIEFHKDKILNIVYYLNADYDLAFIKNIRNLGIGCTFIYNGDSNEDFLKFKYGLMDYGLINRKNYLKPKLNLVKNKIYYFKSSRILYDGLNFYSSEYHYKQNMPRTEVEKIEENQEFWQSAEDFYIFSID